MAWCLCTCIGARGSIKVKLKKTSSLPSLRIGVRSQWNVQDSSSTTTCDSIIIEEPCIKFSAENLNQVLDRIRFTIISNIFQNDLRNMKFEYSPFGQSLLS